MEKKPVVVEVKPHSYQPTREELDEDIGIPDTTPEELAGAILRPVIIQEESVEQRRPRRADKTS
jgi:hypothetical protein